MVGRERIGFYRDKSASRRPLLAKGESRSGSLPLYELCV